jgi:sialic acid synthase SpsE
LREQLPDRRADANLAAIGALPAGSPRNRFSAHRINHDRWSAVAAGARIIEKHFTLDRRRSGPDHSFSLEPDQLAAYIRHIREAENTIGDGAIGPAACEREVRDLARGSVVATRDIRAGELLTSAMLAVKRPGGGIKPGELHNLIGRSAARDIKADTPLAWLDIADPVLTPTGAA